MVDTNKHYPSFIFSEEDRQKLLFQELLSAITICLAALVFNYMVDVKDSFIIGLDIVGGLLFLISLLSVRKHYNLAIGLYLTSSLLLVYSLIFFLPAIKFTALFVLIISLNGFIYLKNNKIATSFVKISLPIGLVTFIISIWNNYHSPIQSTWYNDNIMLLIFLAVLASKIFFLVNSYQRILEYIFNKYKITEKSQVSYKYIFENNSLAIVNSDITTLYKFTQKLKNEQNITDIRAYLNANSHHVSKLIGTIRIKNVNAKAYEMIGSTDKNALYGNKVNTYNQSLKNAIYNELVALFEGKQEFEIELDLVNQQGMYKRLKYFVKYPANLDFSSISYTYLDLTDQQRVRQELKASNERYRTLYANAPVGIIILDIDKRKRGLDCNEMLLKILKVDKHTALNGNMIVLSPENQQNGKSTKEKLGEVMSEFRSNRKPMQFEWLFKTTDNTTIWTEVTFSPLEWEGETQSIMFIKDVTKQKRQQQLILQQLSALNNKNEELEKYIASNLELENFAYIASHDLQAPLRTVISFSNLLEKSLIGKITPAQEEYMKFIVDGTYHMRQLINDLLEFSRVNTTRINLETFKTQNTIELVILDMREHIERKNASITCLNLDFEITADKTKLRQLIQNLVNNALKFMEEGKDAKIIIKGEETNTHWKISVEDNGIGIKKEFQEQIFLLFKRLHGQKEYTGTGIGLALCKKIVEQHQGRIGVESKKGTGSTFHFTIAKNIE